MFESVQVAHEGEPEAIVFCLFADTPQDGRPSSILANAEVQRAISRREFTGKPENIVETFVPSGENSTRVLLAGLGNQEAFSATVARKVASAVGRRLSQTRDERVQVQFADNLAGASLSLEAVGRIFAESLELLAWSPRLYRGTGSENPARPSLTLIAEETALATGLAHGLMLAHSVNLARDLSQTPPNVATPIWIADQARRMAADIGLEFRALSGGELETERLQGLITVGKGSIHPPCMIRLAYRPEAPQVQNKPVVLIGKTITYDTGGLTLKINNGMVGMKRDKDGGCAVLGAMHAIATLIKPDFPVVGLLVAAENSVSENAFRPDDVLTYRNGVTVEVTNTDAEGRLVLADALCWAADLEDPALIVDLATLTGGVVTALGSTFAGLFCEDDALRTALEASGGRSGERVWRLPMDAEYRDMMKSPVADIINSNPNRKAHPIQGAAFLSYFVPASLPWAHIDIAGVHAVDGDTGPFVKGPTGFGVRLLADFIETMAHSAPSPVLFR